MIDFKCVTIVALSVISAVIHPATSRITDVYYQRTPIQCLKLEGYEAYCHPGYPADCYATVNGTPYLLYGGIAINGITCIYPLKTEE